MSRGYRFSEAGGGISPSSIATYQFRGNPSGGSNYGWYSYTLDGSLIDSGNMVMTTWTTIQWQSVYLKAAPVYTENESWWYIYANADIICNNVSYANGDYITRFLASNTTINTFQCKFQ